MLSISTFVSISASVSTSLAVSVFLSVSIRFYISYWFCFTAGKARTAVAFLPPASFFDTPELPMLPGSSDQNSPCFCVRDIGRGMGRGPRVTLRGAQVHRPLGRLGRRHSWDTSLFFQVLRCDCSLLSWEGGAEI